MVALLNSGSFILGLIALILPIVNLILYKKNHHRKWVLFSVMSISACAISLCFQIFYNDHLVKIADWSALMDTTDVQVFAATVLLIITIILNVITMFVYRDRTAE